MSRRRKLTRERDLQVIKGEGRPYSHLTQAAVFYIVLVLLAALVFLLAYHWLGSQYLASRLQIVTAQPGYLENSIPVEGVVTRDEQVVHAPRSGVIVEAASPGERVAAGVPLVTIVPLSREDVEAIMEPAGPVENLWDRLAQYLQGLLESAEPPEATPTLHLAGEIPPWLQERLTVDSERAGLLSYHLDGWEFLSGSDFPSPKYFESLPDEAWPLGEKAFVEAGQPLLKIVNNWRWYFHVVLPLTPGRAVASQPQVTIDFDFAPEEPAEAYLEEAVIDSAAGRVLLTYRLEKQLPGFEQARRPTAVVNYQRRDGILIPDAALLTRHGEAGVYTNSGGLVVFRAVTVIRQQDELVLVEGIDPFTMVITRPGLVREGQRLD